MTTEGSDASSVESHGHSFRSSEAPRFSSIVRADDEQSPDMARPARSAERTRPNYGIFFPIISLAHSSLHYRADALFFFSKSQDPLDLQVQVFKNLVRIETRKMPSSPLLAAVSRRNRPP